MTRQQLKMLVKECMIEILSEGLGDVIVTGTNSSHVVRESMSSSQQRKPANPEVRANHGRTPTQALREAVKLESHGDKVMAEILADTAVRTLPMMMANGDSGMSSGVIPSQIGGYQEKFNGTPEQVFGEDVTSKWAALAFVPPEKKSV